MRSTNHVNGQHSLKKVNDVRRKPSHYISLGPFKLASHYNRYVHARLNGLITLLSIEIFRVIYELGVAVYVDATIDRNHNSYCESPANDLYSTMMSGQTKKIIF